MKRRTVIAIDTCNVGSHHRQWLHDAAHGTLLNRRVTGQSSLERLCRQNTGDQPGGGAAVAGIQYVLRRLQAVKPFAMNQNMFRCIFYCDSHFTETFYCGEAVRALQEIEDLCSAFSQRPKHYGSVWNGFVSRDCHFSL